MPDWTFLLVFRHSGILQKACKRTLIFLKWHILVFYENLSYGLRFKMPDCQTVRYPVSPVPEWKKLTVPEPVRYRSKLMQSGIFFIPVPDWNHGCRNTNASVSFLDAYAQLWSQVSPRITYFHLMIPYNRHLPILPSIHTSMYFQCRTSYLPWQYSDIL